MSDTSRPTLPDHYLQSSEWEVRDYVSRLLALLDDREGRITTLTEELNRTNIVADKLREEMSAVCDRLGLIELEERTLAGILEAIGSEEPSETETFNEYVEKQKKHNADFYKTIGLLVNTPQPATVFSDPDLREALDLAISNGTPAPPSLDDPKACGEWMREHGCAIIAKERARVRLEAAQSVTHTVTGKPVGRKPRAKTEAEDAALRAHHKQHGVTKIREFATQLGISHNMAHHWLKAVDAETPEPTCHVCAQKCSGAHAVQAVTGREFCSSECWTKYKDGEGLV